MPGTINTSHNTIVKSKTDTGSLKNISYVLMNSVFLVNWFKQRNNFLFFAKPYSTERGTPPKLRDYTLVNKKVVERIERKQTPGSDATTTPTAQKKLKVWSPFKQLLRERMQRVKTFQAKQLERRLQISSDLAAFRKSPTSYAEKLTQKKASHRKRGVYKFKNKAERRSRPQLFTFLNKRPQCNYITSGVLLFRAFWRAKINTCRRKKFKKKNFLKKIANTQKIVPILNKRYTDKQNNSVRSYLRTWNKTFFAQFKQVKKNKIKRQGRFFFDRKRVQGREKRHRLATLLQQSRPSQLRRARLCKYLRLRYKSRAEATNTWGARWRAYIVSQALLRARAIKRLNKSLQDTLYFHYNRPLKKWKPEKRKYVVLDFGYSLDVSSLADEYLKEYAHETRPIKYTNVVYEDADEYNPRNSADDYWQMDDFTDEDIECFSNEELDLYLRGLGKMIATRAPVKKLAVPKSSKEARATLKNAKAQPARFVNRVLQNDFLQTLISFFEVYVSTEECSKNVSMRHAQFNKFNESALSGWLTANGSAEMLEVPLQPHTDAFFISLQYPQLADLTGKFILKTTWRQLQNLVFEQWLAKYKQLIITAKKLEKENMEKLAAEKTRRREARRLKSPNADIETTIKSTWIEKIRKTSKKDTTAGELDVLSDSRLTCWQTLSYLFLRTSGKLSVKKISFSRLEDYLFNFLYPDDRKKLKQFAGKALRFALAAQYDVTTEVKLNELRAQIDWFVAEGRRESTVFEQDKALKKAARLEKRAALHKECLKKQQ